MAIRRGKAQRPEQLRWGLKKFPLHMQYRTLSGAAPLQNPAAGFALPLGAC